MAHAVSADALDLEAEFEWLARVLQARLAAYFGTPTRSPPLPGNNLPAPPLQAGHSGYAGFVAQHGLNARERLILALALAPSLRPQLLDALWTRSEVTQRGFAEFGGIAGGASAAFVPTVETACFLLAGDALAERLAALQLLAPEERLRQGDAVRVSRVTPTEPVTSGTLFVPRSTLACLGLGEWFQALCDDDAHAQSGAGPDPHTPSPLAARPVHTELQWRDLVLPHATLEQLEEIRAWVQHGATLLDDWGMRAKLRPGYTSLFHGPPGTGKTLSAALLGKLCGCEVYKIDLSLVVSKYIGETEKNLSRVFDTAQRRRWILFFDEADALFGKRTRVDNAHDRYANQEVSYLLQRVEEFDGVVILASNLRTNIDDAFLRRFQSVVEFPMPRARERLRLWREALPARASLEAGLDLARIAERYELSGGTIMNVARIAALKAVARGDAVLRAEEVEEGIRRELLKEGRAL